MKYIEKSCKGYNNERGIKAGDFVIKSRSVGGGELLIPMYINTPNESLVCNRIALSHAEYNKDRALSFMQCVEISASRAEMAVKVILSKDTLETAGARYTHIWLEEEV